MEALTPEIVPPPTNGAIVQAPPVQLAPPTTARAIIMAEALKEDTEQRAILSQYTQRHMKQGIDYGIIPGTDKPTLLKPGAEKLTDLFRCTPTFDLIEKIEDWEKGLFHYAFRVRISSRDAGTVLAEGFGSANSKEGRYRWRNAGRKCPACGKETICKSKYPPRDNPSAQPGWYCFAKKGGCGAEFAFDDPSIVDQIQGKVENDDIFTLVNTILKMAKKRALVDGAIALARCSDLFTQDVEDFIDAGQADDAPPPQRAQPARQAAPTPAAKPPPPRNPPHVIALWSRLVAKAGKGAANAEWDRGVLAAFGGPVKSQEMTAEQCAELAEYLFPEERRPEHQGGGSMEDIPFAPALSI